jgi:hypothetical protein
LASIQTIGDIPSSVYLLAQLRAINLAQGRRLQRKGINRRD